MHVIEIHIMSNERQARVVSISQHPKMQKQFVPIIKNTYCITDTHITSYTPELHHYLCGGAGNDIWIC